MLSEMERQEVFQLANHYVSAHNTQPAHWFFSDNELHLFEEPSRKLSVADPESRDHKMSLGSSIYCMKLALSTKALGIKPIDKSSSDLKDLKSKIANTALAYVKSFSLITDNDKKIDLAGELSKRRSFRGFFKKASPAQTEVLRQAFTSDDRLQLTFDRQTISKVAVDFDSANYSFLSKDDYLTELNEWLRFDRSRKDYDKDGLNPEAMALSKIEAMGAKYILKPKIFSFFKKMSLGKTVISEEGKVKSASAIGFLILDKKDDAFQWGADFTEVWLKLSQLGFSMNPLSCLTDSAEMNKKWSSLLNIDPSKALVNAFRIGPTPNDLPESFRRDAHEVFEEIKK